LKAVGHLPASVSPPAWIAGAPSLRPRGPRTGALFNLQSDILPMANGLLTVSSRELIPHTPAFFSHNKLAFDFDPEAPLPSRWLRFLAQLWPEDKEAIGALQEVIGYLLAGGTSLQKIFLIVG